MFPTLKVFLHTECINIKPSFIIFEKLQQRIQIDVGGFYLELCGWCKNVKAGDSNNA